MASESPEPGVSAAGPFLELIGASMAAPAGASLIAFRSGRHDDILKSHGAPVAAKLMSALAESLQSTIRPGDELGVLDEKTLGVLIRADLAAAQDAAQRIHHRLRERFRFPVFTGVCGSLNLGGGGAELRRLACEAAEEASRDGARSIRVRTVEGPHEPSLDAAPAPLDESGLAARYQRLVLLNRMSLELFSDSPFPTALAAAANVILALTQAKYVAIYFCDDFGQLAPAFRHGAAAFGSPEALAEESAVLARTVRERRILTSHETHGWLSAPLFFAPGKDPAMDGAFIVGYAGAQAPSAEREQTMLEIGRLLRNARIIQRNLQHQQMMAAVSEQAADATFITNVESRVVTWNSSAERLFQWKPEEIVGKNVSELYPEDRREENRRIDDESWRSGSVRNFETVGLRKDGGLFPAEATVSILRDASGSAFGIVRVFRDIARRKEVEQMKSEFVALVSHELRTPLTAILGFSETILDFGEELSEEKRRTYLNIIIDESKRLGNLVTNFLDISRLEAGGTRMQPEDVELPGLLGRLESLFREHPSKAVLKMSVAPDAARVRADPEQLYRILLNLCGNALRYSPAGGTVEISSRRDGDWIELSVGDQGPGIPAGQQDRLFQKFSRLTDDVSRRSKGTGLGLSICKGIVEAHGGRIWVESAPGRGTTFRFTMPAPDA